MPILIFLLFIGLFSTTYILVPEKVMLVKDSPLWTLAVVVLAIIISFVINRNNRVTLLITKVNSNNELYRKISDILFLILGGISVFWILTSQYIPNADQYEIQSVAYRMHFGDYREFAKYGYIGGHVNQVGMLLVSYVFSFIFGNENYIVFQLANAVALIVIYKELVKFGCRIGLSNFGKLLIPFFGIIYLPMIIYVSFVYGNMGGLALTLVAINSEMDFFEKRNVKNILISSICIAFAMMLKSNFMIFLIGMLIYAAIHLFGEHKKWTFGFIIALLIFSLGQSKAAKWTLEIITGEDIGQGSSPISYIAMGLQESGLGPGWYNAYNDMTYIWHNYDTDGQKREAIQNIKDRLGYFKENPWEAVSFFTRKTASQWNEPTYESIWLISNDLSNSQVRISSWVYFLASQKGNAFVGRLGKIAQILVLSGTFLFVLFNRKRNDYYKTLTLIMMFIGGFLFHLFWEAKSQYTISYFILLLPYAIMGYESLNRRITFMADKEKIAVNKELFLTVIVLAVFMFLYGGKCDYLTADTESYIVYAAENTTNAGVENGDYTIGVADGREITLLFEGDSQKVTISDSGSIVRIMSYQGKSRIYFPDEMLYLQYGNDRNSVDVFVGDYEDFYDYADQSWIITETDGGYIIETEDGRILTVSDNGEIFTTSEVLEEGQTWHISG
ncbi:hypothetical protein [Butyrivibrio proteoclasticus]|uniref:hypothetical protein n=1 Tax=Butyrivibrio proteoclasticus TaxID=43305 RepID=UPI001A9A410F|nr:hypothetical protein [Butyrivibrio proteoclasticus]